MCNYDKDGYRLTDCCSVHSVKEPDDYLHCKKCHKIVSTGQGDGTQYASKESQERMKSDEPDEDPKFGEVHMVGNDIKMFLHCRKCVTEWKDGKAGEMSPRDWARLEFGYTEKGLQVRCVRHECNVVNINFEGCQHPADTGE